MVKNQYEKPRFQFSTKKLVLLALMVALNVVLGRLNIPIGNTIRISVLGFLPFILAAWLLGPAYAALAAAAGDIVSFLLFNHVFGPLNPGLTLTAALSGLWYGMVLYKKDITWLRACLAVIPVIIVCEMGLNTLWLYLQYPTYTIASLPMRLLTNAIECPVKVLLVMGMTKLVNRIPKSYLQL